MFGYQEALDSSIKYFNGNELAASVFVGKYALKNKENELLESNPDQMHRRLAKEFARIEKDKFKEPLSEDEIYEYLKDFKRLVMQGSPMYGIGNPYQYVSVGNCFVLPSPLDSYLGINYLDTQIPQISCRRGGVGWNVSNLRPKNTRVSNAAKSTSGCVEFVKRFSNTIREVCQDGRRGASLQSLHCLHPDVFEFIKLKQDLTTATGSNISIQFTDFFMNAVVNDEEIILQWPVDSNSPTVTNKIKAKDLWKEFVHSAWLMAEPGCMFIDTVHRESTGYHYGHIEISSNPCGEQYLPAYASCRLLLANLIGYVKNKFTNKTEFDFISFSDDVKILQRLGDDLVDLEIECVERIINKIESDPEPEYIKVIGLDLWRNIKETAIRDRRTGCGFTALGDTIAALNMKYDSPEAIEFCEKMQRCLAKAAYQSSVDMAKELGPFPQYDKNIDIKSGFIQRIRDNEPELYKEMCKYGRRNMVLLTVAPTGSVSCLTQTTSGIEPVFELEYTRRKKGNPGDKGFKVDFTDDNGDHWMHFKVYHKGYQDYLDINPKGSLEKSPYYKSCANEINWINRVKLQAAIGKWVDNSISSTVNLPNDVSEEVVNEIYLTAWKEGLKGITIYRDGCRTGVLVVETKKNIGIEKHNAPERPKELECDVHHVSVKGKQYFVLVGLFNGEQPYEVFAGKNGFLGKTIQKGRIIKIRKSFYKAILDDGTELSPVTLGCDEHEEALTRMTSVALRHGVEIQFIVEQLSKVEGDITSFSKSIIKALKKYIKNGVKSSEDCQECGNHLIFEEGCQKCSSCGWSKC